MPQMAPMNWLNLFIAFSFIFVMFNYINYFNVLKMNKKTYDFQQKKNSLNWKW